MLKLGRTYIIDFQDARLGPIQYDLVSLVHDSYVDLSPASIAHVKNDYITKARTFGPKGVISRRFRRHFSPADHPALLQGLRQLRELLQPAQRHPCI